MIDDTLFFLPDEKKKVVDVLLVTGDAYLDHPSFGIAIIARVLENAGYTVCIVSQPDYKDNELLNTLPDVRLFIGISSGNLDSIVSNYTGNRNRRKEDCYSVDGIPAFPAGHLKRPDRATIVYTSFFKQKYKGIPIILGGLEASLRRFAHYDYVQDKIRRSLLLDSKADLLIYSMGEKSILETAARIADKKTLRGIQGTAHMCSSNEIETMDAELLPSYEEIAADPFNLTKATEAIEGNMVPESAKTLVQLYGTQAVVSYPPQPLPTTEELDAIYALPYRKNYPAYCERVPAWRMIKDSITSHRGCYGKCSFCAIASHQGPLITSRSEKSILNEVADLTAAPFFNGTVSDVGGPTANMYGSACKIGGCKDPHCLYPSICSNLVLRQDLYAELLRNVKMVPGVKNVFVTSGLRFDIALTDEKSAEYIIVHHTSGLLKVAPEHMDRKVLSLMRKPDPEVFERFLAFFEKIKKKNKFNFYILPYVIISHPGSDDGSAHTLGKKLLSYGLSTKQYQDFTPVPGTIATAMYLSGKDSAGKPIYIQKHSSLHNPQRKILEKYLRGKNNKK